MMVTERKRLRAFQVKPTYRVAELAEMLGMSRFAMLRLLKKHGIRHMGEGRGSIVLLVSIREGLPELWESMVLARSLSC